MYCLNTDTFTWRELSPTSSHRGPLMKSGCGMIAVQFDGEDYLLVTGGGYIDSSNNPPQQPGAQYRNKRTNETHYFKISTREWISPTVTDDRPPPCDDFTLTSITNNSAALFGGYTGAGEYSDRVYVGEFSKSLVTWKQISKPSNKSVKWPEERCGHSSVLITNTTGPHLLVVGGFGTSDCWLLDINKGLWRELSLPLTVTRRYWHSLSVWSVTPSTSWIIEFGGYKKGLVSDTAVIELTYSDTEWSVETLPLNQYQEKLTERRTKWVESLPETERQLHQELQQVKDVQSRLQQELHQSQQQLQESMQQLREKDRLYQEQISGSQERERALDHQLQEATSLLQLSQQTNEQLQNDLREAQTTASSLFKQKAVQLSEKDEMIQSLRDKLDEEKKAEKEIREELHQTINDLKYQLQESASGHCSTDIKHKEISVQFDYRIPQSDLLQGVHIAAAAAEYLFLLQGDSQQSFNWEQYGFRLHSTQGTLSKSETCEVAVTPIVSDNHFQFPEGTVLVSAVYAISVAKSLLKPLVIELQHCVDLRTTGQTGCLKFVQASLDSKPPHQFTIVKGGVFSVGSRYGSIERDKFSAWGIVAEMSNGEELGNENGEVDSEEGPDPDSESDSQSQGSHFELLEETDDQYEISTDISSTVPEATNEAIVSMEERVQDQQEYASITTGAAASAESHENVEPTQVEKCSLTDILYTGMMYHEQRGIGQWRTTYTVAKDLQVITEYLKEEKSHAEEDGIDTFKFAKPNGTIVFHLPDAPQQCGWTVHPRTTPTQLSQEVINRFQATSPQYYCSCPFSVYARLQEPNTAKEPLHYTIPLDGVVPKQSICINRSPPVIPLTTTGTPSGSDHMTTSETRRESDENGFRADVAYQVLTTNTSLIKNSQICLHSLADKLLENKIINETERGQITDDRCGLTTDQRMDKLLDIIKATVKEDGEDFDLFLEILRQEDTRRANRLVKKLIDSYKSILRQMQ